MTNDTDLSPVKAPIIYCTDTRVGSRVPGSNWDFVPTGTKLRIYRKNFFRFKTTLILFLSSLFLSVAVNTFAGDGQDPNALRCDDGVKCFKN